MAWNIPLLNSRMFALLHFDWRRSPITSTKARAIANGQLRTAVIPIVENTWIVLDIEGGFRENACASVTPYIAKVEGRYATYSVQLKWKGISCTCRCSKHPSAGKENSQQIYSHWRRLVQLYMINKWSLATCWCNRKNDPKTIKLLNLDNINNVLAVDLPLKTVTNRRSLWQRRESRYTPSCVLRTRENIPMFGSHSHEQDSE